MQGKKAIEHEIDVIDDTIEQLTRERDDLLDLLMEIDEPRHEPADEWEDPFGYDDAPESTYDNEPPW